ncbi:RNA polymerase [Sunguru virus]|uniref:Replicase n=1 Tax=Sunguru virus TaxID=1491491 RepID=A0A023T1K6_9RHAB|nr:RNA polymerase [Sunguru virus]AHX81844.1 RNA polymerase [Sunguru virus]
MELSHDQNIDDWCADWGLEEENQKSTKKAEILNLSDYNLNSPLLIDWSVSVFSFRRGLSKTTGSNLNDSVISQIVYPIKTHEDNHRWFGNLLRSIHAREKDPFKEFEIIFAEVNQAAECTAELTAIWLDHLKLPYLRSNKKFIKHDYIKHWGQLLYEVSLLIIYLNNPKLEYAASLLINHSIDKPKRLINNKVVGATTYLGVGFELMFRVLRRFTVCSGGIITSDGFALDKNFLLMIKDVVNSRVCAYLSAVNRVDSSFSDLCLDQIVEVWKEGDKLLQTLGNSSYNIFKMIEPVANNELVISAQTIRPLIKLDSEFEKYVEQEIQTLVDKGITFLKDLQIKMRAMDDLEFNLSVYGSFRQWGHPYIDFTAGLEKLYQQVTMPKKINAALAKSLASDLALKVLETKFNERREWMVHKDQISANNPLRKYIVEDIWPPFKVIHEYGDRFHELPLRACFEIPDFIDPTQIYSDKAHSIDKDELKEVIRKGLKGPVPTKRVLDTLLRTEQTNWKEFLTEIDRNGLEEKWLIIGLKPKERELKIDGRYFALLSWKLREYFVITEYLIKTHFVKLYDGLTMADDLKDVVGKLLSRSMGQGTPDYTSITFANHIDYSKWNNHQRKESNGPLFRVMGQFLGFPSLIERTHEFFEKSLIYYAGDLSLLRLEKGNVVPSTSIRSCWQGQPGGLEGLRQKGWSLLNIVLLDRISKKRNTRLRLLAQGDNQIVCSQFRLTDIREDKVIEHIEEVKQQNKAIMADIESGTGELGLIINKDETMLSTEYLNYGKVPVYRGNICGLKTKRWARVSCYSNDNLPNLSNILSTVSSTALSISHFSLSPVDPMLNYSWFGVWAIRWLQLFDPCLAGPIPVNLNDQVFLIKALYLDPSLGGVSGMCLNRFLIRNFPDPLTEGLSFWKVIFNKTKSDQIRKIAGDCFNPAVRLGSVDDFKALLEDPTSINIPRGLSPITMLRNEIKINMVNNAHNIKNQLLRDVTVIGTQEENKIMVFLRSIKPIFPKFLAQLKASTITGIKDSFVSMYENSRTIRKNFRDNMRMDFDLKVIQSETMAFNRLLKTAPSLSNASICSSSQADLLRKLSWGSEIVGMTIPHPIELIGIPIPRTICNCDIKDFGPYLTTVETVDDPNLFNKRGSLTPYLGSKTSEGTSIISPWEKESKIPFLKRVLKMRNVINWFVKSDSNLAASIFNLIESITGEKVNSCVEGYARTGSAIHRFSCDRQSSGGYSAVSPAALMRLFSTTDTLGELNSKNWDFMFQSLIIMSQTALSKPIGFWKLGNTTYHSHIQCRECLREIHDIHLEASHIYQPKSFVHMVQNWISDLNQQWVSKQLRSYDEVRPANMTKDELDYNIGQTTGFLYGELIIRGSTDLTTPLFPNSIGNKLQPRFYFLGLTQGLILCATLNSLSRNSLNTLVNPISSIGGNTITLVNKLIFDPQFLSLLRSDLFMKWLLTHPHRIPPSYPLHPNDQAVIIKSVLRMMIKDLLLDQPRTIKKIILFSDSSSGELELPYVLSAIAYNTVMSPYPKQKKIEKLRTIKNLNIEVRDKLRSNSIGKLSGIQVFLIPQEIRHVVKFGPSLPSGSVDDIELPFGEEYAGWVSSVAIEFQSTFDSTLSNISIPQKSDPTMSGLRPFQIATGAHYKVRCILKSFDIKYNWFLCGGDGSGGITSCLLRYNLKSQGIFNSLMDIEGISLRGSKPAPPSAVEALGKRKIGCLNHNTVWQAPSDLRRNETWDYFSKWTNIERRKFDLLIFDMELTSDQDGLSILKKLDRYLDTLLVQEGSVIYKTYLNTLLKFMYNPLHVILSHFSEVHVCQTELSSSSTSEVYIFGRHRLKWRNDRFPTNTALKKIIQQNFVFSDGASEFERAKQVRRKNLLMGVPRELIPDLNIELENLLNVVGVPAGLSNAISDDLLRQSGDIRETKWTLIRLCDKFVMRTCEILPYKHLPSDQILITYIGFLVGGLISLYLDDDKQDTVYFQKVIQLGVMVDIQNDPGKPIIWKFGSKGKGVNIRCKMALIGSTIRVFERLSEKMKTKSIKLFKHHYTLNLLKTGIPQLWDQSAPLGSDVFKNAVSSHLDFEASQSYD